MDVDRREHREIGRDGTPGDVMFASMPFIIASGVMAVKLFCDRVVLAWYSDASLVAALASGTLAFLVASPFIGVSGYASCLVAQHRGAGEEKKIGPCVWRSILFSLAAGMFIALIGSALSPVFGLIGHAESLAEKESGYFTLLTAGSAATLLGTSLSCFWLGRGRTWTVVIANVCAICINVFLNLVLVFGASGVANADVFGRTGLLGALAAEIAAALGIPALGLTGAAIATIVSDCLKATVLFCLFVAPENRLRYATLGGRVFEAVEIKRLLLFGFGNGGHFLFSIGALTVFNVFMGAHTGGGGGNPAAASGIALSVNSLAFIPMVGMGTAVSMLVGRGVGAGDVAYVRRVVKSAVKLGWGYAVLVMAALAAFPYAIVGIFGGRGGMDEATLEMAVAFLGFAGVFLGANTLAVLYGSAIRGAGDTRYAMRGIAVTGWLFLTLPCLVVHLLGGGAFALWGIYVVYATVLAMVFYHRFRRGGWERAGAVG